MVDDDCLIRDGLRHLLEAEGHAVADYGSGEDFLSAYAPGAADCLLLDARLPGMSGLDVLQGVRSSGHTMPVVMITGHGDITMAVDAMKAGASDFLEKPVTRRRLMDCVDAAVKASRQLNTSETEHRSVAARVARLTQRQGDILALILAGQPNKNIAVDMGISQRTVENHRASIMKKMQARSLAELVRIVTSAGPEPAQEPAPEAPYSNPR